MNSWLSVSPILLIILVLLGIVMIYVLYKKNTKNTLQDVDYKMFLILGLSFFPIGFIFMILISPGFIGIFGLGVIYLILGIVNHDKWKETS